MKISEEDYIDLTKNSKWNLYENEKQLVRHRMATNHPVILAAFIREADLRHEVAIMLFWPTAGRRGAKLAFYLNNNRNRNMTELYDYCMKEIA